MMSCQSLRTASGSPVKALRRLMPALFTSTEAWPILPAISEATRPQESRSVTSSLKLQRLAAGARDRLLGLGCGLRVGVEDDDTCALLGVAQRDRPANARAAAGDHGNVSLEKPTHARLLRFLYRTLVFLAQDIAQACRPAYSTRMRPRRWSSGTTSFTNRSIAPGQ